ncbi:hypothetical protein CONLIGDRAFT_679395 [Coniochaeta ligniaria NRRL 30616]|uniref:Uncharacterized protein n=1 Tax=Coniochaeta ligniaria NRRL 30616 TaxID=1408157 RepID=A0A1J7JBF7_9PEZI|nr:hypothetical protein CONLIGDRAFT_679395 [Coniochaeta ligniaria NRRL 30616]
MFGAIRPSKSSSSRRGPTSQPSPSANPAGNVHRRYIYTLGDTNSLNAITNFETRVRQLFGNNGGTWDAKGDGGKNTTAVMHLAVDNLGGRTRDEFSRYTSRGQILAFRPIWTRLLSVLPSRPSQQANRTQ